MYKKVIECLKDMSYDFREYEAIHFTKRDFSIHNVIEVEKNNLQHVYLEFREDGAIWVWSIYGDYQYEIRSIAHYKMIFKLCWILNN